MRICDKCGVTLEGTIARMFVLEDGRSRAEMVMTMEFCVACHDRMMKERVCSTLSSEVEAEIMRLRDLIRTAERARHAGGGMRSCPWCNKSNGHAPDCAAFAAVGIQR